MPTKLLVLALRWADVDLDERHLLVRATLHRRDGVWCFDPPKTSKGLRWVPIPQQVVDAMRRQRAQQAEDRLMAGIAWLSDSDPAAGCVFTTHAGEPLSARNMRRAYDKLIKESPLRKQGYHDLRHATASLLARSGKGAGLIEASKLLGHNTLAITADLYTHIYAEATREAMGRMGEMMSTLVGVDDDQHETTA